MTQTGQTIKCEYCGREDNLIHHHESYEPEIVVLCCRSCHAKAHREKKGVWDKTKLSTKLNSNRCNRENEIKLLNSRPRVSIPIYLDVEEADLYDVFLYHKITEAITHQVCIENNDKIEKI